MNNTNDNLIDDGLQKVLGDHYTDATNGAPAKPQKPRKIEPVRVEAPAPAPAPVVFSKEESRKLWQPAKPDPDDVTRVKNAAKWSVLYGSLCFLFFYWEQVELMAPAAAVPSMLACMLCAGVSVGKNLRK